ncbi:ACN9-domain-containing protein [Multifurca ochricompacta]|uniref:Succinate dehydrogenase assembly factor 3 n=1 Tax=Multifurca ochricompacta TaxID=376703 RepID=A0AAD4M0S1_9AGAM|nr:ACN9-domain-containing protein [Multifurca ochricompacta]
MHATISRLAAETISKRPLILRQASASLIPPIPLYRRILRAHRFLPIEMRSLGDDYVKAEFRRHKDVTNPGHIIGFLSQWNVYLDQIPSGAEAQHFRGKKLDPTIFEKLSEEQLGQMYELMRATKDIWKPVEGDPDVRGDRNHQ